MVRIFKVYLIGALLLAGWVSCSDGVKPEKEEISKAEEEKYIRLGDSLAQQAQKVLVSNLIQAIQEGGPEYAVEFCHIQASPLTDSIANAHGVVINRIAERNRNPDNGINGYTDSLVIHEIKLAIQNGQEIPAHFLKRTANDKLVYYKPIKIGMPTCLVCHGKPETDISPATLQIIKRKYPLDLAIGFQSGDFRGLWKVSF